MINLMASKRCVRDTLAALLAITILLVSSVSCRREAGTATPASWMTVAEYGALGDGTNDDTAAIQSALDGSSGGAVVLAPGSTYVVTDTLILDPAKVRLLDGMGAQIRFRPTTDKPLLHVMGSLSTGTASPDSPQTLSLRDTEFMPIIKDINLYASARHSGTGIRVEQTFGLILDSLYIQGFAVGIEFVTRNRNVVVSGCHIWDNELYGIWFNNVNQHQTNINACHVSYSDIGVYVDNGDVHNLQITGCDIETAEGNIPGHCIRLKATAAASQISQVLITGNSIEAHLNNVGALVSMEGVSSDLKRGLCGLISIVGNQLSGSGTHAISARSVTWLVVAGNTIALNDGYAILLAGIIQSHNISSNTVGGHENIARWAGFITAEQIDYIRGLTVTGNIATNLMVNPIVIDACEKPIEECSIVDNVLQFALQRPEGAPEIGGYAISIETSGEMSGVRLQGNQIRLAHYSSNGMRLRGSAYTAVFVADNTLYGLPPGRTGFDLPEAAADRVLVRDNLLSEGDARR